MNVSLVLFAFFYKINLSFFGSSVQNLSRIFSCPEFVQFKLSEFLLCPEFVQVYLSGICPKFYTGQILDIFWTKSGYVKILGIKFVAKKQTFSGQFLDMPDLFWTISGHFRRHFPDIYFLQGRLCIIHAINQIIGLKTNIFLFICVF